MNSREPFDLAKIAIGLLLVVLVIGATIAHFYGLFDTTDRRIDSMQKATASAAMDRLYDLKDLSDTNAYQLDKLPLVTNIVSALSDFSNEDLLYIIVKLPQEMGDVKELFVYEGVTITNPGSGVTIHESDIPMTEACRLLLQYSNCTARLNVEQVTIEGYKDLSYVTVEIYDVLGGT